MLNAFVRHRGTWTYLGLLASILTVLAGCGAPKVYPVRGRVLFRDTLKPLTEGEIRFQPISRPSMIASGNIKKDGTFSLSTPDHGEGALEGACRAVILVEPKGGKPVIADRFKEYETADLRFTVTAREENYFIIEVSRPGR